MMGYLIPGSSPLSTCRSVRQTPQTVIRTRTSPGPGSRSANTVHVNGAPACSSNIASMRNPTPRPVPAAIVADASMRDQNAAVRIEKKIQGHAAKRPFAHAAVTVGARHDQIGPPFPDKVGKSLAVFALRGHYL